MAAKCCVVLFSAGIRIDALYTADKAWPKLSNMMLKNAHILA